MVLLGKHYCPGMSGRFPLIAIATLVAQLIHAADSEVQLPCKTPRQLLAAVQKALEMQDTNSLWKLHTWTNVSSRDERLHKTDVLNGFFKSSEPGETISYSSFSIHPAPTNTLLTMGFEHNIPTLGVITFTTKRITPSPIGKSPIKLSSEQGCLFGKGADGNFWLAVGVVAQKTNKPPAASH